MEEIKSTESLEDKQKRKIAEMKGLINQGYSVNTNQMNTQSFIKRGQFETYFYKEGALPKCVPHPFLIKIEDLQ
jgi:hypothetical protein